MPPCWGGSHRDVLVHLVADAELLEMLNTAKHIDPDGLGDGDEVSSEVRSTHMYS